jgi:hypothetical protein
VELAPLAAGAIRRGESHQGVLEAQTPDLAQHERPGEGVDVVAERLDPEQSRQRELRQQREQAPGGVDAGGAARPAH